MRRMLSRLLNGSTPVYLRNEAHRHAREPRAPGAPRIGIDVGSGGEGDYADLIGSVIRKRGRLFMPTALALAPRKTLA